VAESPDRRRCSRSGKRRHRSERCTCRPRDWRRPAAVCNRARQRGVAVVPPVDPHGAAFCSRRAGHRRLAVSNRLRGSAAGSGSAWSGRPRGTSRATRPACPATARAGRACGPSHARPETSGDRTLPAAPRHGRGRDGRGRGHLSASSMSRICLASSPPPYPPNVPSLRTTRWQGTTSGSGFVAHAVPAARTAFGLPAAAATAV